MTGAFPRSFPLRRFDRLIIPATESKIDTRKTNNERFFAQSGYEDRRRRRWQKEGKKNGAGAQGAVLLRWLTFPLFVGPILLLLIFFLIHNGERGGPVPFICAGSEGEKKIHMLRIVSDTNQNIKRKGQEYRNLSRAYRSASRPL